MSIDKEKLAKNIGRHIERKLQELNITQKELSVRTNMTEAGISRYISGQRLPRIDILLNIADALNCTIDYLLFGV
jgi:transcriptional regulator with XRE-family HTH domain